jgi:tRNA-specific 2-thiouridylase
VLRRSVDAGKDQSYVLAVLTRAQLAHAMFPLGGSTKDEVRAEAARRGLAVADKPDSHDICFIPDGDTAKFLRDRLGEQPGEIVDAATGEVLGEHDGAYAYTVGQRRGLKLGRPAPDGKPRYVLDISPVTNTVRVGPAAALDVDEIVAERPVWTGGAAPTGPFECLAQMRAHGEPVPATATLHVANRGDVLRVDLRRPARGIAPGQAVVLYQGDVVLGSATISSARSRSAAPA